VERELELELMWCGLETPVVEPWACRRWATVRLTARRLVAVPALSVSRRKAATRSRGFVDRDRLSEEMDQYSLVVDSDSVDNKAASPTRSDIAAPVRARTVDEPRIVDDDLRLLPATATLCLLARVEWIASLLR
jgi:hypothetical protein